MTSVVIAWIVFIFIHEKETTRQTSTCRPFDWQGSSQALHALKRVESAVTYRPVCYAGNAVYPGLL